MRLQQVTIFGAGLIGGSIAHAARERSLANRLVAVDVAAAPPSPEPFDAWVVSSDETTIERELSQSSLTILCVPVHVITKLLPRVLDGTSGWVTDCGSTKAAIVARAETHSARDRFVPGHPMAGHPEGGLKNARADLFVDRKWIVCPDGSSSEAQNGVTAFVEQLGARVVRLGADEHDRSVAVTSHVPQVIASALSVFAEVEDAKQAAGPGFASSTRVAGGAEAMWRDIFETNAHAIGSALSKIGAQLQQLGAELDSADVEGTLEVLERARQLRDKA